MKTIIIKSFALFASVGLSVTAFADMQPLAEAELQEATGQQGINMSAKLEFAEGTRLSFANPEANYKDEQDYWLVVDNITGSVEIKNMKTEFIGNYGPYENVGAVVTTLPESIEFDNFRTDGRSEERRVGKECRSRWWAYH